MIITKLDGTAKGGALFSIARELELPIFYVGVEKKWMIYMNLTQMLI